MSLRCGGVQDGEGHRSAAEADPLGRGSGHPGQRPDSGADRVPSSRVLGSRRPGARAELRPVLRTLARPCLAPDRPRGLTWVRAGDLRPLLDRATLGVTPFAKPRISRVTIGGRPVQGPASYVRLFTLQGKAESLPDEPDWQPIRIVTGRAGPWSSNAATLEYSPSKNVLWRSIQFVKVSRMTSLHGSKQGSRSMLRAETLFRGLCSSVEPGPLR